MRQVRPVGDFHWPYGGRHELRRDDKRVAPMPVADQLGERRERRSALAGAERRDQKRGVALVEECRRALLVAPQAAGGEGAFIAAPPSIWCTRRRRDSSDCSGRPAAQSGSVSISRRRIAFASSARASSTSHDDFVVRRHADRHERERRVGLDSGYR